MHPAPFKGKPVGGPPEENLTLECLATVKRLPAEFLRDLGVRDLDGGGVSIPYFSPDGSELFRRERGSRNCHAKKRFHQPAGVSLQPYGLGRLGKARKDGFLILVEGESDCWALWEQGLPALGIPGSNSPGVLTAEHLAGLHTVYVSQESDPAGVSFVELTVKRLGNLAFDGKVFVLTWPDGCKDPADLYALAPERFLQRVQAQIMRAKPAGSAPGLLPMTPQQKPIDEPHLTDKGNAIRLAREHGKDLRHCFPWSKWADWSEKRWHMDDTGESARCAKEITLKMFTWATSEMGKLRNLTED